MLMERSLEPQPTTTFFYYDHADKRTLDPANIFRSLALQVLRTLGDLPASLLAILERICQDSMVPETEDSIYLLLETMKRITSAVIVLDGLDEVNEDDRKLIFRNLRDIILQATSTVIKVFIASREDTSYLTQVPDIPLFKLRIGTSAIAGDIDSYVRHAI